MKSIVFVDPIISTSFLVENLRKHNVFLIAVYTITELSEEEKKIRFQPELFDEVVYLSDQSIEKLANGLKKFEVDFLFYGYEGSVHLLIQNHFSFISLA